MKPLIRLRSYPEFARNRSQCGQQPAARDWPERPSGIGEMVSNIIVAHA